MFKKVLSLILAVALFCCIVPLSVAGEASVCVTGLDKVKDGTNMDITARAYVSVMIDGTETVLYGDAFTSAYKKNG